MSIPATPPSHPASSSPKTGLPTSILFHAGTLLALGTSLILRPQQIVESQTMISLNRFFGFPTTGCIPSSTGATLPALHEQVTSNTGIAALAVGLCYVGTALASRGMPRERIQFLYASVTIRLADAGIIAAVLLVCPQKRDVLKVAVLLADGIGGTVLGLQLGTFSGMVPTLRKVD